MATEATLTGKGQGWEQTCSLKVYECYGMAGTPRRWSRPASPSLGEGSLVRAEEAPWHQALSLLGLGMMLPNGVCQSWDHCCQPSIFPQDAESLAKLVERAFYHMGEAGLELLTSSDPPTSASQSAGMTGSEVHTLGPVRERFPILRLEQASADAQERVKDQASPLLHQIPLAASGPVKEHPGQSLRLANGAAVPGLPSHAWLPVAKAAGVQDRQSLAKLGSRDQPVLASQSAGITGMNHHGQPFSLNLEAWRLGWGQDVTELLGAGRLFAPQLDPWPTGDLSKAVRSTQGRDKGFALLTRLVSNSWPQVTRLPQLSKVLGLQV
ncbi:hypothetical protein AAY473_005021 [Plecturocebus cupreus]